MRRQIIAVCAAIWYAIAGERAAAKRRLRATAQALAVALDSVFTGQIAALDAFTTSTAFGTNPATPDLTALYAQARRLADQLGVFINITARVRAA